MTRRDKGDAMTHREILELRKKIETDPILTDEEIEFIWHAIHRQYPVKTYKDGLTGDIFRCIDCGKYVAKLDKYCWSCGQRLDWEEVCDGTTREEAWEHSETDGE